MIKECASINILPPAVYNLLSAGEVVENPASVVKELAENAIDAGATKIDIEIVNGGVDEIVVTDNGVGCPEADLPKVFLPHATSKIATAKDIDGILSLGFRGEAMASVAAVSSVEFTSKTRNQSYAVCIGNDGVPKIASGNDGSRVRVSNLFYNTPARRKFLKSTSVEKNAVTAAVHNIIFSHPDLAVKYTADGETVIDFRGTGLLDAIMQIYGVGEEMLPLNYSNDKISVGGFISSIKLSKKNKSRQVVIINGRVTNGGIVADTVNEVMSNFLMVGEYPIFVLCIEIDTAHVDVNVHPQKKEVRFDDKDFIVNSIEMAVTKSMDEYFISWSPLPRDSRGGEDPTTDTAPKATPNMASGIIGAAPKPTPRFIGRSFDPNNKVSAEVFLQSLKFFDNGGGAKVASAPGIFGEIEIEREIEQTEVARPAEWKILGQIFETYLLVSTETDLLIIDQHAMAERINYDAFKRQIDTNNVASQILLEPIVIKLSPREAIAFEKIRPHLTALGFECAEFGTDAIRVISMPIQMSAYGFDEFLRVLLADRDIIRDKLSDILKDRIAMAACKASIKGGDALSPEQIQSFLTHYRQTNIVPLCPHGRPIMIVYSKSKIEGLFGRK
jgi:DNA mismatch repair protein MutL